MDRKGITSQFLRPVFFILFNWGLNNSKLRMIPATARKDSWNPVSKTERGEIIRRMIAAEDRTLICSDFLSSISPIVNIYVIITALTTDTLKSVKNRNGIRVRSESIKAHFFFKPNDLKIIKNIKKKIPVCNPLTESKWAAPV